MFNHVYLLDCWFEVWNMCAMTFQPKLGEGAKIRFLEIFSFLTSTLLDQLPPHMGNTSET